VRKKEEGCLSEASFLPRRTIAGKSRLKKQWGVLFSSLFWTSKKGTKVINLDDSRDATAGAERFFF